MGKEIRYRREIGTALTEEQIKRIEAARDFEDEYDDDCPVIDPIQTPELYRALVQATGERNRRTEKLLRELA